MEPKAPTPNMSPEVNPTTSPEQVEFGISSPESTPSHQPEKQPSKHERVGEMAPQAAPVAQPQTTVVAPPAPSAIGDDSAKSDDTSSPAIAADDDKIEKEWVNKAKSIVEETKSDPYLQEEKVSKLQADYLQKRYNKKVKLNSD